MQGSPLLDVQKTPTTYQKFYQFESNVKVEMKNESVVELSLHVSIIFGWAALEKKSFTNNDNGNT